MFFFKRFLLVSATTIPLLMFNGCFPTDSGHGNQKPKDTTNVSDTTKTGDDPSDLPKDINTAANISEAGIDSMFNLLITRAQSLEDVNSPREFYAVEFASLRKGFGAAVNKTPNHVKANVGFIVSSVLSINGNPDLQKVIDSIDVYINDMDFYYEDPLDPYQTLSRRATLAKTTSARTGLLSKTYTRHGVLSTGQALFAETPKVLMAQTGQPSFPRFLTMSYIQNMIETAVVSRLNEVIASTQRLRSLSEMSLPVIIDGETYEIDVGDIFILEGITRAARAGFMMMLVYDYDLYSPDGSKDMRWVDSFVKDIDDGYYQSLTYKLQGDTLYEYYYSDVTDLLSTITDVCHYNMNRADFLAIRRQYHSAVYNDLKEIPVLIKAGLAAIKNEKDSQDDDLIPSVDVFDLSSDMGKFSQEMLEEGFSTALASKFQSPEALMDFISLVLTQPYTFDETIENMHIKLTVDLSQYFTNPAHSLKEYWPKYRIPTGNDQYVTVKSYESVSNWSGRTIYVYGNDYDTVVMAIPPTLIDSVGRTNYIEGSTVYYLKNFYRATKTIDSSRVRIPIQFIDDTGNPINSYDLIDEEMTTQSLTKVFPYFNDYTFKGIFPDMKTRKSWVDFFSVFFE